MKKFSISQNMIIIILKIHVKLLQLSAMFLKIGKMCLYTHTYIYMQHIPYF